MASERGAGEQADDVHILLVSEDAAWRADLAIALLGEGYVVLSDDRGDMAFERPRLPVDLAVVDMGLSMLSPVAVCAALRAHRPIPILAVQSVDRETIVLSAYEAGADQFVSMQTPARVLVARIRALLRRVPPIRRTAIELRLSADETIVLDPVSCAVRLSDREVELSEREFDVLHALLLRPGLVVPRSDLIGDQPGARPDRGLDFVIRRLREKLEAVGGIRRIEALRGVGFRFVVDETEVEEGARDDAARVDGQLSSTS